MNEYHDDVHYIHEVLRGNREAFRVLVQRYSNMVYSIAYSMTRNKETAQDTVQEVFYRVFRKLADYNPTYPFGAWLRRITVNYMLDQKKKRRIDAVSMTTEEDDTIDVMDNASCARGELEKKEQEQMVLDAVYQLPEKYRMVLLLRHFEQLSYEEIAESLSVPLGTVMTHLHRARTKLAEKLEDMRVEMQA